MASTAVGSSSSSPSVTGGDHGRLMAGFGDGKRAEFSLQSWSRRHNAPAGKAWRLCGLVGRGRKEQPLLVSCLFGSRPPELGWALGGAMAFGSGSLDDPTSGQSRGSGVRVRVSAWRAVQGGTVCVG
ncbi:hypothetical protein C2845_PM16G08410 [Panicum miliaceum]|uniref:Uncharacterized protein n=1 Tax=Panicum miliaceum TaxID=4540 RepID=A0A3L6Q0T7_PANMI|nr:hypothetical protein C2845_PM16G08410 [Panicum miliaceum]